MSAQVFNLSARQESAGTLMRWLASQEGGLKRAGLAPTGVPQAAGQNTVTTDLSTEELARMLSATSGSAAGIPVNADNALRVATVYGCVSLIAGAIATLPLAVFERTGEERKRVQHDYSWLFNEQANEEMSSATAWECLIAGKLFHGDGYAELLRPSMLSSRVIGWKPLHPLATQAFKASDKRVYFRHLPDDGPMRVLDSADVIHLPSLGFDGLSSPSPITYAAREAIGIALAAERYSARFFSGGASFDYALHTEHKVDETQLKILRASLMGRTDGTPGGRGPLILGGGLKPAQLSVNPKDAEILKSRVFSVEEICRIFGVPPHMVGHTDKSTSFGSGIEQQGIGFVRYTLQRHLTPIAQEFNRKLWPTRARYFCEHITAALERGDLKGRFDAYRVALGRAGESPFITVDEVRRLENMPAMPANQNPTNNTGGANAQPSDPAAG
jgi:HK97 family phage portal protein